MDERRQLPVLHEGLDRRDFLRIVGASAAWAACEAPREKIIPYVRQPEGVVPGRAQRYATSMVLQGYATGLLAESHVGRPTRVDGNPLHPASLGASGIHEQASIFDLYDPARARSMRRGNEPASWETFVRTWSAPGDGRGLHFLLQTTGSPLVGELIARIRTRLPEARFHFWDPLARADRFEGTRRALGRPASLLHRFDAAKVIVSLDADFLGTMPFRLRHARDFSEGRRLREAPYEMNRLYVAEPEVTITGTSADHRLRARPGEIPVITHKLFRALRGEPQDRWIDTAARDLLRAKGEGVVLAGERQVPSVHVLALACNALLGNLGRTVVPFEPALLEPETMGLDTLAAAIRAGEVTTLVMVDVDPAWDAPPDLELPTLLPRVRETICVGLREGLTSRASSWFIPGLHYLESWGDARAYDGTVSFVQPLIRPLYGGKGLLDVLAVFAGQAEAGANRLLRERWSALPWEETLQRGFLPGTASPPIAAAVSAAAVEAALAEPVAQATGLELSLPPDPKLLDGSFGANDWLLELPDPVTKLTWTNAVQLGPRTAERLGLRDGRLVEISVGERRATLPCLVVPGTADDVLSISLGWGRHHDREGEAIGADAWVFRGAAAPVSVRPLEVERELEGSRPAEEELALAQPHQDLHDRKPILLSRTLAELRRDPAFAEDYRGPVRSLYGAWPAEGPQWGMTVDLTACIGCAACVIACQAENNIPVVGKANVRKGREMHWIRIDRYLVGGEDDLQLHPQPMLCQHCEKAPCEYVCPVNATVHSPDGLNEMVYNRCIGTRFCSNNCPYKVRKFNYFEYNDLSAIEKLQKNPQVTVRARGVMEKCTYCVQRIRGEEIEARIDRRPMREIVTACQSACPTHAIVFGLISDPESEVSKSRRAPHAYAALHELGAEPRTRYLARIRNANEELP